VRERGEEEEEAGERRHLLTQLQRPGPRTVLSGLVPGDKQLVLLHGRRRFGSARRNASELEESSQTSENGRSDRLAVSMRIYSECMATAAAHHLLTGPRP